MNIPVTIRTNKDVRAVAALSALFIFFLIVSWQRWTRPLVDHGREMNLPARVLAGEQLYVDILYFYGPVAPHFNALLYRVFGVHITVLYVIGVVCAVLILAMCYWLARQIMNEEEATLATALILLICAFNVYYGNYFQPYSHAALYGFLFALCSLVCAVSYVQHGDSRWMLWAGISAGLTIICKPELGALAGVPVGVAWLIVCLRERRLLWSAALTGAFLAVTISSVVYGLLLLHVPWQTLFVDNYRLLSMPQMVYFSRFLRGTLNWPKSISYIAASSAMILIITGGCALSSIIIAKQWGQLWRAWRVWIVLLSGFLLRQLFVGQFQVHPLSVPFRNAPLLLMIIVAALAWRLWRDGIGGLTQKAQILLVLSIFSLIAIVRFFFNVSHTSAYTPFTLPTIIIISLWLLFRCAPGLLLSEESLRERMRRYTVIFVTALVVLFAVIFTSDYRRLFTFEISAPRGKFFVEPEIGRPMAEAIRFIQQRTRPNDEVLVLPQGTGLNFLTGRHYPLREECVHPGFVEGAREATAIERLSARRVPVVVIYNLLTPEFRDRAFGVDYNQNLMRWIEEHYRLVATFGSQSGRQARFGDQEMFFSVYERDN
jgi:4-amino-4-deoxy-L-arabinose transferase-like glycosyltransferase